jgi:hypothetical protein
MAVKTNEFIRLSGPSLAFFVTAPPPARQRFVIRHAQVVKCPGNVNNPKSQFHPVVAVRGKRLPGMKSRGGCSYF